MLLFSKRVNWFGGSNFGPVQCRGAHYKGKDAVFLESSKLLYKIWFFSNDELDIMLTFGEKKMKTLKKWKLLEKIKLLKKHENI